LAGQAAAHLVAFAALRGLVCRGPDRAGDEPTYVLLDDWVGAQPRREPDAALAELAHRYVAGHGPATVADLAAWSGAGMRLARRGGGRGRPGGGGVAAGRPAETGGRGRAVRAAVAPRDRAGAGDGGR